MNKPFAPRSALVPIALACAVLVAACGVTDPVARALEQRARWSAQLLGWAQSEDGRVQLSTRLAGPASSDLGQWTVRVQFYDAEEKQIGSVWYTFDLAQAPRGGPVDLDFSVPGPGVEVHGVYIDPVLDPDDEERTHLVELPH